MLGKKGPCGAASSNSAVATTYNQNGCIFSSNVSALYNRCAENIKVFENFFDLFYENQGKKISSPAGQNLDIPSSTVFWQL